MIALPVDNIEFYGVWRGVVWYCYNVYDDFVLVFFSTTTLCFSPNGVLFFSLEVLFFVCVCVCLVKVPVQGTAFANISLRIFARRQAYISI